MFQRMIRQGTGCEATMTSRKPPAVATWLLQRSTVHESVVGDLFERYQKRQSSAWYWRQVLLTILVNAARDVREHKLLAVRAVVTGFAVLFVSYQCTWSLLNSVHGALWINGHWYQPGQLLVSFWYPWVSFGGAASGWIVGRLYRAHRASMTFAFAGSFLIGQLVQLCVFLTIAPLPIWFTIGDFGFLTLTVVVSILVGGLWVPQVIPDSPETARSKR